MSHHKHLIFTICLLLAVSAASADTKVVQSIHTAAGEIMGQTQAASDTETVTWYSDKKMASLSDSMAFIVRQDLGKLYMINHNDKTYTEVDMPVDFSKLVPPQMAKQISQMMTFDVTVTPTSEYRQIGQWNARRYDVKMTGQMMSIANTVWATTETDIDAQAAWQMSEQILRLQPGMAAMAEEMSKIEGFQIASESVTSAMGSEFKTSSETTSISDASAPAGTYDPPAGYTLTKFNPMTMGR